MDTPLYVLSTAASMVESVDISNYKQIEEAVSEGSRVAAESTGRTRKTASMLPPYDGTQRAAGSNGHPAMSIEDLSNSRKCAGTQTAFSSFSNSSYGSGEKYAKTDSSMAWPGHKSSCPASPPGYYNHHKTIATAPRHNGYHQESMDTDDDMPLNLTKSSSSHQSNSSTSSASATCPVSTTTSWGSRSSHSPPTSSLTPRHTVIIRNAPSHQLTGGATQPMCNNSRQDKVLNDVNDPEIEEHFRRSLGTKYDSYVTSRSSPQNAETAEPSTGSWKPSNVSITGNVDDHFAKSLGDTWTQIKAQQSAVQIGTVDDHFAKALGDTWFKIKTNTES